MIHNTIIGAALVSDTETRLRSMLADSFSSADTPGAIPDGDPATSMRLFKIRAASTAGRRSSASVLINRRYAWRGYQTKPLPEEQSLDSMTLVANDQDVTIGTMSVGFEDLLAEELFPEDVRRLRDSGHHLCEFTKLALDSMLGSKCVLASLIHVAYIFAYRIKQCDTVIIEVNPRHVKYYEKMLGFKILAKERMNLRVNAPAVLMSHEFAHFEQQIGKLGGQPHLSAVERTLYPFFFSVEEEAGIVGRLKREPAWAPTVN